MVSGDLHISDQELLQAADGELAARRASEVHAHLAACWNCRARMAEINGAIADFVRGHRQTLDSQLPSADGPRALLRARLAELAHQPEARCWRWLPQFNLATRALALCAGILTAALISGLVVAHSIHNRANASAAISEPTISKQGALPERSLTPGATRRVTIGEVCSIAHEEVVREVSASTRKAVFEEYGIKNARSDDYEIDYLIAPGLGGIEDIHNLWPQPFNSATWNAHVKDALEERLHQMVCAGNLDLPTAQREIATDWIAAYKKYFQTNTPKAQFSIPGSTALHEEPDFRAEETGTPLRHVSSRISMLVLGRVALVPPGEILALRP
jgi:hypothetical protein